MSAISFSPNGRRVFLQTFKFTQDQIQAVVDHPDRTEQVKFRFPPDLVINVHTKEFSGRNPSVMLVATNDTSQREALVVYRLFNDFDKDVLDCAPIELLSLAADRFGADIAIGGGAPSRFFMEAEALADTTDPRRLIDVRLAKDSGHLHVVSFVHFTDSPPGSPKPLVGHFAFVTAVDEDRYARYLRKWTR